MASRRRGSAQAGDTLVSRFVMQQILSTMSNVPAATPLPEPEYHRLTAALLAGVEAQADAWLQADVVDIDTQRSGGLLELAFPNGSKIILNAQPPLQELWLAAKAGGFHFRHVAGRWLNTRDGSDFFDLLSQQASAQAGQALRFEPSA